MGLALPSAAFAGWEGKLSIKPLKSDGPGFVAQGRVLVQDGKSRMEMDGPMGMKMVTIGDGKKQVVLHPSQSTYLEHDLTAAPESGPRYPSCAAGASGKVDPEACLQELGYKKTGAGEANGYACAIYERTSESRRGPATTKLWRPTKLKDAMFVRVMTSHPDGSGVQMDVTELKEAPLDKALFEIPKGYTKQEGGMPFGGPMGGPMGPRGPGGGPGGPTKEQMEEMMKRYQQQKPSEKPVAPPAEKPAGKGGTPK